MACPAATATTATLTVGSYGDPVTYPLKSSKGGFTLLELVVVLFILAAASAIVLPRLPRSASMERSEALRLMSIHSQAAFEHSAIKKKA